MTSASVIVTFIVLGLIIFFTIHGFRKGFLKILFTTFSFVLVLIISAFLTKPVANFLQEETFIGSKVESAVGSFIDSKISNISITPSEENNAFIDSLLLPTFVKDNLKESNTLAVYTQLGVSSFKEYVSLEICNILMEIISYILLALIISIFLRIIFHILKIVSHIPVLRGINRFLGLFVGFLEGLLIIWCVCIIISLFSATNFGISCMQIINESKILSFLYNNNLLVKCIAAIFSTI